MKLHILFLICLQALSFALVALGEEPTLQQVMELIDRRKMECESQTSESDLEDSGSCPHNMSPYFNCWPRSKIGANVTLPCNWVFFNATDTVTKKCLADGTWENVDIRSECSLLSFKERSRRRKIFLNQHLNSEPKPTKPTDAPFKIPTCPSRESGICKQGKKIKPNGNYEWPGHSHCFIQCVHGTPYCQCCNPMKTLFFSEKCNQCMYKTNLDDCPETNPS